MSRLLLLAAALFAALLKLASTSGSDSRPPSPGSPVPTIVLRAPGSSSDSSDDSSCSCASTCSADEPEDVPGISVFWGRRQDARLRLLAAVNDATLLSGETIGDSAAITDCLSRLNGLLQKTAAEYLAKRMPGLVLSSYAEAVRQAESLLRNDHESAEEYAARMDGLLDVLNSRLDRSNEVLDGICRTSSQVVLKVAGVDDKLRREEANLQTIFETRSQSARVIAAWCERYSRLVSQMDAQLRALAAAEALRTQSHAHIVRDIVRLAALSSIFEETFRVLQAPSEDDSGDSSGERSGDSGSCTSLRTQSSDSAPDVDVVEDMQKFNYHSPNYPDANQDRMGRGKQNRSPTVGTTYENDASPGLRAASAGASEYIGRARSPVCAQPGLRTHSDVSGLQSQQVGIAPPTRPVGKALPAHRTRTAPDARHADTAELAQTNALHTVSDMLHTGGGAGQRSIDDSSSSSSEDSISRLLDGFNGEKKAIAGTRSPHPVSEMRTKPTRSSISVGLPPISEENDAVSADQHDTGAPPCRHYCSPDAVAVTTGCPHCRPAANAAGGLEERGGQAARRRDETAHGDTTNIKTALPSQKSARDNNQWGRYPPHGGQEKATAALYELEARIAVLARPPQDALAECAPEWRATPPVSPDRADREAPHRREMGTFVGTDSCESPPGDPGSQAGSIPKETLAISTATANMCGHEASDPAGHVITELQTRTAEAQAVRRDLRVHLKEATQRSREAQDGLKDAAQSAADTVAQAARIKRWVVLGALAEGRPPADVRTSLARLGLCGLAAERDAHRALQAVRRAHAERAGTRTAAVRVLLLELLWHDLLSALGQFDGQSTTGLVAVRESALMICGTIDGLVRRAARSAAAAQSSFAVAREEYHSACAALFAADQALVSAEASFVALLLPNAEGGGTHSAVQWEDAHRGRADACASARRRLYRTAARMSAARCAHSLALERLAALQAARTHAADVARLFHKLVLASECP